MAYFSRHFGAEDRKVKRSPGSLVLPSLLEESDGTKEGELTPLLRK